MKIKWIILILAVIAFLFISCSLPVGPTELYPAADQPPENETALSIETDTDRGQGVYINEKGLRIDIKSVDDSSGELVKCVEAIDLAIIESPEPSDNIDSGNTQVKAIVVGKREDGRPGIWEIHSDDTIHSPWNEAAGARTCLLPESFERQEGLRDRFGWTYQVTDISEDGKIAVGYAVNERGFRLGRWTIDSGTTVGVYWRLWQPPNGYAFGVRRARVIGIPKAPQHNHHNNRWLDNLINRLRRILSRLRLFFLHWFESYLIMADSVTHDAGRDVYLVSGKDQDGMKAVATIDLTGVIAIEQDEEPGEEAPDLIVTSVIVPTEVVTKDKLWTLGAVVENTGDLEAGPSVLKYYLSADPVLDIPGDDYIGSSSIGSIAVGYSVVDTYSSSYSISQGGTWYIFAVADADSGVAESDEENNTLSSGLDIIFDRIIIETFFPTGVDDYSTDTYLVLYDSSGDPSPGTPYDDTGALAEDRLSNPNHTWYSYIDYTLGLAPGTYYIKVRGNVSTQTGPYGIRVLAAPIAAYSYFGATNPISGLDDSYEDDDPMTGQIPTSPLSIRLGVQEDWHNRALAVSDID